MQKIHSLLFFLFIVNIGLIAQPIPENNKVLILNFDDNTLVDESQNNHQIINRGTSFSTGIRAEGIELDGVDNYLEVEHEPSLLIPENVTMSVWYQHVDQKDTRFYSLIEQSTPENGGHSRYGTWIFDVNRIQTCVEPDICPSLCQRCVSSEGIELQDRQWYHIVTTYDGLFLKIYIDGELNIERNFGTMTGISTRPQPLTIGTDIFGSPNFLKGKLDEIGLYNIALNEDQIQTLFNQTTSRIESVLKQEEISIYPNPTNGHVEIVSEIDFENYAIFDSIGKLIERGTFNQEQKIDFSNFTKGVYSIILKTDNQIVTKKIILVPN